MTIDLHTINIQRKKEKENIQFIPGVTVISTCENLYLSNVVEWIVLN